MNFKELGKCEGYIDKECPNCGRMRVEHYSCGKDICEKCGWSIQDKTYIDLTFDDEEVTP